MSASSKKKLRNAQEAEKLTERQLAEQKEAKKMKVYTTSFVAVLAILLVIAVTVGVMNLINGSGVRERSTIAMTVNGEKVNSVEMSYFFMDYVQNYANQNIYLSYMMDVTLPLDQQVMDPATGETWADYFLAMAQRNVQSVYALSNAAKAEGYTLSADELASLDATFTNLDFYASIYGFGSSKEYLQAMYGSGADLDSYRSYCERSMLANSYYNAHSESITYDDAAIRAAEEGTFDNYSSFTYSSYYMPVTKFLEGGTTTENGGTLYSDEEKAAAQAAALEAAEALTDTETITTLEALDEAIAALPINASLETPASSSMYTDVLFTSIDSTISGWLAGDRAEGDLTYIARTSTAEDGSTEIVGYYIVWFVSRDDNTAPLANVRHILIGFEGGTTDANGNTVYSEAEIAAAWATAEDLLTQWENGEATEESFAALAGEYSTDPGSVDNGGLYTDVRPGDMVASFDAWCFDNRQAGDTGIVETSYGVHIMYYSGDSDLTYRDAMIADTLLAADMETWYNGILETCPYTIGEKKYLPLDMVLSAG